MKVASWLRNGYQIFLRVVENTVEEAIQVAKVIGENSLDAVWTSREGIFMRLGDKGVSKLGKSSKIDIGPLS
jgi:hypothetical protein